MQNSASNGYSLIVSHKDSEDGNRYCEGQESDPSGRYIRYNEVLGKGAFKTVYRGFDEIDGIEVAWNQIKLQDVLNTPGDLERLYAEVHLLKTLKHKNIIKFHHSWVDMKSRKINFITEFFTSGTLREYRNRHKHVSIKAVKNWCRQILRGLLYLHSHDPPIIHRDLKCDNIFINGNQGEVKIGDLGLAAILFQSHSAHSIIGTPEFMAPELYEEQYNELVDIYSFGMCLLEMVTFEYPYSECINAAQIYKKVTSGIKPAALDKIEDKELRRFVEKCLASASNRQPARELLMDPFLQPERIHDVTLTSNASNANEMSSAHMLADNSTYHENAFVPDIPLHAIPHHLNDEKTGRNMSFQLKGKRRENHTVYLRLRITEDGEVRIIHFPFHVEADTAMCVASEMVEELDLADQDVIKIADMIDSAVMVMVPEWKPGVAFVDHLENEDDDDSDKEEPTQDGHYHSMWSDLSTFSWDSSLMNDQGSLLGLDDSTTGGRKWASGMALGPQRENVVHGRFEEVTYHECRVEHADHIEEERCSVDTLSSRGTGEWQLSGEPMTNDGLVGDPLDFHEKASNIDSCNDGVMVMDDNDDRMLYHTLGYGNLSIDEENDELLMQQIRALTLRYEKEVDELRRKHEDAILELRKQWKDKKDACPSFSKYSTQTLRLSNESRDEALALALAIANKQKEQYLLGGENSELSISHSRSNNDEIDNSNNRLSFKELATLLANIGSSNHDS